MTNSNTVRRRYELLLPLQFYEGSAIPDEAVGEVLQELMERFGAASSISRTVNGVWRHGDRVYHDLSTKVWVDVPDTDANHQFFKRF